MLSSELHKNVGLVALCAILLAVFASTAAGSQEQTQDVTKVTVLGERTNEYSGGREILAGKIVLGRNWLENTAASSVSEALRRESSVSVGSGGRISLKGLSGYTQMLLDGQPQTGGKDPMLLDPALIERIEIIHSASADSGAFSIAGTINIVTRNLRKELPTQITFSGGGNDLNNDEELSYQGGWRDSSGTTFNFNAQASHLRSLQNGDAIWNWTHADGRRGENKEITGDRTRDRNLSVSPSLSFKPSPADHVQLKGSIYIYRTAYGNDSRRTSDSTFSNGDLRPRSSKYSDEHDGGSLSLRGLWNHKLTHGGQSNVSIDFTQEQGKQKFDTESYWSPSLDNSMLATENSKKNFLNGRWQLTEPNRNGHKLQYALSAKLFSKQNDRSSLFDGVASSGDWSGKLHEKFNAIDIAA